MWQTTKLGGPMAKEPDAKPKAFDTEGAIGKQLPCARHCLANNNITGRK